MNIVSNKNSVAWFFILPAFLIHLVVVATPSILSLALCLTDWNGFGKINFIGFENFNELFDDRVFKKAIVHNIIWTVIFLTIPIALSLTCAYLLTGIRRGQLIFRLVFFFPYMLASIISCQIWKYIFHPLHGIGVWLSNNGIELFEKSPFAVKDISLYAVALVDGWHFWGFLVVIYITGMYQVDHSMYEAADLEGATKFQKFRFITLPMIRPIFIFTLMIIIIWSIPTFDYIYILTQGGPAYSSEVLATHLYSQAFDRFNVGYSSAIGTLMFFYVLIIVSIFGLLQKIGWEI
ncbi:MAG TPA: sugar ABC transporter permease [SAR324 cluster bacterium]|jgi:raffinose/stachyose/melibiose transport system permease protein|nr:sugar ABC transporter permease [SAR324 cluster bacterium]HJO46597.1 sugar ABC transporter permease [SAR324 cluster bacterium]|tara:strand:+ start:444 stop:1319 length:876 start_codon:yes stop_codon:yes gene_type:complete